MRRLRRDETGFTLVELLVVILLTAILGGVVLTSIVRSLQVSAAATARVEALTDLQRAQERMSRNIRPAAPLSGASATGLTADIYETDDSSGTRVEIRRTISYAVDAASGTITQTTTTYDPATGTPTTGPTVTVIDELTLTAPPVVFTYLDATGGAWDGVAASDIRHVSITLRKTLRDAPPVVLTTGVFLRNAPEDPIL